MFVVTGGGSGIGKALALALAEREQSVLIIGRTEQSLLETAAYSPLIEYCVADISTETGRASVVKRLEPYDTLCALVNNAGQIEPITPLLKLNLSDWNQVMSTNLQAPMFLTQALYPQLKKGRVLNIGSGAAYFPVASWGAYCVSKAALSMLTRVWQVESEEVLFTSVMPGIIDTNMQDLIRQSSSMDNEKHQFFQTLKEENRLIPPETVAAFLCWLLLDLDAGSYVSKEWDIYDESHHPSWLKPPHTVSALE